MTRPGPAGTQAAADPIVEPATVPAAAPVEPRSSDRPRRGLGVALMAWGAAGLVIIAVALGFVNGLLAGDAGPLGIEGQRRHLLQLLESSGDALAGAETAARNADGSLLAAGGAAGTAAAFMQELAGTMNQLAGSLRINILGSQPFAAPAEDFERVAASAARVAVDLEVAATGIRLGGEDMAALADELAVMRSEVDRMAGGISGLLDTRGWQVLASIVLAWLGIPALVSFLVGYRWLRRAAPAPRMAHPDPRSPRVRGPVARVD